MKTYIKSLLLLFSVLSLLFVSMSSCEKEEIFLPDLALNTDTISITRDELISKVLIYSNTNWSVEIEDPESSNWLTLPDSENLIAYNGSGTNYFLFKAEANAENEIRYGTFIIKTATSRKTLVIIQNR